MSKQPTDNAAPAPECASDPTPTVFVVGAGAVGTTLAARLVRTGVPVIGLHGRRSDLSEAARAAAGVLATTGELPAVLSSCDVIVIAVRDSRIPEIAKRLVDEKRLRPEQVVLHTSGSLPAAEALAAVRGQVRGIGTLHPLVAVTEAAGTVDNLGGAAFGLEGEDAAVRVAKRLVRRMGGRVLDLKPETMPLYHAGAVLASNYLVALADVARSMLVSAGIPEEQALPALLPLMSSAVHNLVQLGVPGGLTGPVVRGDVGSVEKHLKALDERTPEHADLYRRLGREVLRLTRKRVPEMEGAAVDRLAALFNEAPKRR